MSDKHGEAWAQISEESAIAWSQAEAFIKENPNRNIIDAYMSILLVRLSDADLNQIDAIAENAKETCREIIRQRATPLKASLEAELKRLNASQITVIFDWEAENGLELWYGQWATLDLNILATMENWKTLPNKAGWEKAIASVVEKP